MIIVTILATLAFVISIWAAAIALLAFKLGKANHELWEDFWKHRGIRMKNVLRDDPPRKPQPGDPVH
jgi:hypothetical protein